MQLLVRNKPTSLLCIHNLEHEIEWDSDEPVFVIEYSNRYKKYIDLNDHIGEFLVWNKNFDLGSVYIARHKDFDDMEMF